MKVGLAAEEKRLGRDTVDQKCSSRVVHGLLVVSRLQLRQGYVLQDELPDRLCLLAVLAQLANVAGSFLEEHECLVKILLSERLISLLLDFFGLLKLLHVSHDFCACGGAGLRREHLQVHA